MEQVDEVCYYVDPESGEPHIYVHGVTEQEVDARADVIWDMATNAWLVPCVHVQKRIR